MCFNKLFDIKSIPELFLGFNFEQIYKISVSEILENSKLIGVLDGKYLSKFASDGGILEASFGPIWEKKLLKPFEISR